MPKHVLIIGAGVIGLCCGHYLSQRRLSRHPHRPSRREPLEGCSFGNAGLVVPSHFVPLAAPGMVRMAALADDAESAQSVLHPAPARLESFRLDVEIPAVGQCPSRRLRSALLLRDLNLASRAVLRGTGKHGSDNDFELVKGGLLMLCNTGHCVAGGIGLRRAIQSAGDSRSRSRSAPNGRA